MNELVIKAQNIDEDIKGMPLLEQIKYAADLYQEMITSARNLDELKDTIEDRLLEHISWGQIVKIKKYLK